MNKAEKLIFFAGGLMGFGFGLAGVIQGWSILPILLGLVFQVLYILHKQKIEKEEAYEKGFKEGKNGKKKS